MATVLGIRVARGYEPPAHAQLRGKFVGHILPGLLFMLWGCEWRHEGESSAQCFPSDRECTANRHLCSSGTSTSLILQLERFSSNLGSPHLKLTRLFFYLRSRSRHQPLHRPVAVFCKAELFVKVVAPTVGILSEMSAGHWRHMFYQELGALVEGGDNVHTNINNYFHATMHLGFLVAAIVDLLEMHWKAVPQLSGLLALSMAFSIEGLLFGYHAQMHQEVMKNQVESLAHRLLLVPVYLSAAILLAEFVVGSLVGYGQGRKHTKQYKKATKGLLEWLLLVRALSALLQGSWMFRMPFMPEDMFSSPMASRMATAIYFGWHWIGCVFFWITCLIAQRMVSKEDAKGQTFRYDLARLEEIKSESA